MKSNILEDLKKAIVGCDAEGARSAAEAALKERIDPLEAMNAVTEAIRLVGGQFEREEIWLPELVGAATAMQQAVPIFEEELRRTGGKKESIGSVVIGTVKGDIHSIGKSMVATLLLAEGFSVHDLGVDVGSDTFIREIQNAKPALLAMSALMTTTSSEMKKVIESVQGQGLRQSLKIIVGGAPITDEFARRIGADGFSATAPGGAKLAARLAGK
jgi:5-methyltetrahydrofolate--homocysteine methyltransferase